MKKVMFVLATVAAIVLASGCTTTKPVDAEKVHKTTYRYGALAGVIVKAHKTPADTVNKIYEIMDRVDTVVCGSNTTYEVAWMPEVDRLLEAMEQKGEIDAEKRAKIRKVVLSAIKVLDYVMAKNPEWKLYPNIAHEAVDGFVCGFKKYSGADAPVDPADDPDFMPIDEADKVACTSRMEKQLAMN